MTTRNSPHQNTESTNRSRVRGGGLGMSSSVHWKVCKFKVPAPLAIELPTPKHITIQPKVSHTNRGCGNPTIYMLQARAQPSDQPTLATPGQSGGAPARRCHTRMYVNLRVGSRPAELGPRGSHINWSIGRGGPPRGPQLAPQTGIGCIVDAPCMINNVCGATCEYWHAAAAGGCLQN